MEEREYLARVAMIPVPITKDGSTRLFQDSRPADGSMPIFTEKNWIPIRPSQKPGAESPQIAKNIPPRSAQVPRLMAHITPIKIPKNGAHTRPAHTNWMVNWNLDQISSVTGILDFKERPISPLNKPII